MCRRLKFPPVVLILGWILLVYVQDLRLFRGTFPLLKLYVYDFVFWLPQNQWFRISSQSRELQIWKEALHQGTFEYTLCEHGLMIPI